MLSPDGCRIDDVGISVGLGGGFVSYCVGFPLIAPRSSITSHFIQSECLSGVSVPVLLAVHIRRRCRVHPEHDGDWGLPGGGSMLLPWSALARLSPLFSSWCFPVGVGSCAFRRRTRSESGSGSPVRGRPCRARVSWPFRAGLWPPSWRLLYAQAVTACGYRVLLALPVSSGPSSEGPSSAVWGLALVWAWSFRVS